MSELFSAGVYEEVPETADQEQAEIGSVLREQRRYNKRKRRASGSAVKECLKKAAKLMRQSI